MFFHFWIKIIAASYFLTGRSRVGDSLRMITSEEETIIKCFFVSFKMFHTPGARGAVWGFGALLKGLTSVMDNSCRSRDSNPQPRVTSPTLYPLQPRLRLHTDKKYIA